jgi:hypothetical protein
LKIQKEKDFIDKLLIKKDNDKIFTASKIGSTKKTSSLESSKLEINYDFNDKNDNYHELKLLIDKKVGVFKPDKFACTYYIDKKIITQKENNGLDIQWIDPFIKDERILITAYTQVIHRNSNGTVMSYCLVGMLNRLDFHPNDSLNVQKIKNSQTTEATDTKVLIDKTIDLSEELPSKECPFLRFEKFFLGKDNEVHILRLETENNFPTLTCRVFFDGKLIKVESTDKYLKKALINIQQYLNIRIDSMKNDRLDVNIHIDYNKRIQNITVTRIDV